ncbi:hypothetical protein D3C87_1582030 [compost metagenome]
MCEVVGQTVFGIASLLDFGGDVFELLIRNFDQHADLIVFMTGRAFQPRRFDTARIAAAEFTNDPCQGFGQHHIEQGKQDAGQQQAPGEAVEQGHFGPTQEPAAEGIGVDVQAQGAEGFGR